MRDGVESRGPETHLPIDRGLQSQEGSGKSNTQDHQYPLGCYIGYIVFALRRPDTLVDLERVRTETVSIYHPLPSLNLFNM